MTAIVHTENLLRVYSLCAVGDVRYSWYTDAFVCTRTQSTSRTSQSQSQALSWCRHRSLSEGWRRTTRQVPELSNPRFRVSSLYCEDRSPFIDKKWFYLAVRAKVLQTRMLYGAVPPRFFCFVCGVFLKALRFFNKTCFLPCFGQNRVQAEAISRSNK